MNDLLTHVNARGEAHMVDVSEKDVTHREAIAESFVVMRPETLALMDFKNLPIWQANHDCVVSDYGDLVAVPA